MSGSRRGLRLIPVEPGRSGHEVMRSYATAHPDAFAASHGFREAFLASCQCPRRSGLNRRHRSRTLSTRLPPRYRASSGWRSNPQTATVRSAWFARARIRKTRAQWVSPISRGGASVPPDSRLRLERRAPSAPPREAQDASAWKRSRGSRATFRPSSTARYRAVSRRDGNTSVSSTASSTEVCDPALGQAAHARAGTGARCEVCAMRMSRNTPSERHCRRQGSARDTDPERIGRYRSRGRLFCAYHATLAS